MSLSALPRSGHSVEIISYRALVEFLCRDVSMWEKRLLLTLCSGHSMFHRDKIWEPRVGRYVDFTENRHGQFLKTVKRDRVLVDLHALYKVFCVKALLSRTDMHVLRSLRELLSENELSPFLTRNLELLMINLTFQEPPWYHATLCDVRVSAEIKMAVELLWAWLKILYMGHFNSLSVNLNCFLLHPLKDLSNSDLRDYIATFDDNYERRFSWLAVEFCKRPTSWFEQFRELRWVCSVKTLFLDWQL